MMTIFLVNNSLLKSLFFRKYRVFFESIYPDLFVRYWARNEAVCWSCKTSPRSSQPERKKRSQAWTSRWKTWPEKDATGPQVWSMSLSSIQLFVRFGQMDCTLYISGGVFLSGRVPLMVMGRHFVLYLTFFCRHFYPARMKVLVVIPPFVSPSGV